MDAAKKSVRPTPKASSYTQAFWDGARDRKLMLQYDPASRAYQFWPRPISIRTGRADLEWRQASGKGTLYSVTTIHVPGAGFEDRGPYPVGLVELDEGVRLIANLVGVTPESAQIGMRLRVTWEPLGDTNYYAFEPDT